MKNYLRKFKNHSYLTILCIGDSTTSQDWTHPNWYDWLRFTFTQGGDWEKDSSNRKIFNNGRDGGSIDYFLKNFDREVKEFKPDAVIVSLGFNHFEDKNAKQKAEKLFRKIKAIKAEIIAWSPYESLNPKYSKTLAEISGFYRDLTKKYRGVFIDIYSEFKKYDLSKIFTFEAWENPDWDMKAGEPDFIHCNEVGNQIIVEKIAKKAFGTELEWWGPGFGQMTPVNLKKYLKKKKN